MKDSKLSNYSMESIFNNELNSFINGAEYIVNYEHVPTGSLMYDIVFEIELDSMKSTYLHYVIGNAKDILKPMLGKTIKNYSAFHYNIFKLLVKTMQSAKNHSIIDNCTGNECRVKLISFDTLMKKFFKLISSNTIVGNTLMDHIIYDSVDSFTDLLFIYKYISNMD